MSVLTQAANSYQYYATNNPILTNSFTGFLIASVGDVLCQKVLDNLDKKRAREKKNALLASTQKEFNYFGTQEHENVRQLGTKLGTNAVSFSPANGEQNVPQSKVAKTLSSVKRNTLKIKNVLLPNLKKSTVPVNNKAMQMTIVEEKSFKWDSVRTIHLGVIRALVIAPFVQWWYPVLLRTFPGKGIPSVMGRVVMDQVSGSPLVVIMVFVASAILQGNPLSSIKRIQNTYLIVITMILLTTAVGFFSNSCSIDRNPLSSIKRIQDIGFATWLRGLQYWPFVHTVMHTFIPLRHQTLFAHFCSLYWNAVLSYYVNLKME